MFNHRLRRRRSGTVNSLGRGGANACRQTGRDRIVLLVA